MSSERTPLDAPRARRVQRTVATIKLNKSQVRTIVRSLQLREAWVQRHAQELGVSSAAMELADLHECTAAMLVAARALHLEEVTQ